MKRILGNAVLLGTLVTGVTGTVPFLFPTSAEAIALPAQRIPFAPGQDSERIQPIELTPQQNAKVRTINQQFQTRYDQILTPEQLHLRELARQNPEDPKPVAAFLTSLSPQQKQALKAMFAQLDQDMSRIYTPQQARQFQHNINARIAELKAEQKLPRTYHFGFWQPAARIDPTQPMHLRVINETNSPLQYGLTTGTTNPLTPGSSADLYGIFLPANVLIYPLASSTPLKYTVRAEGNAAIVTVRQMNSDTPGDSSIAINHTGAIYIY